MSGGITPEGVRWLRHTFPLRPNFVVTLELPRDLRMSEAERLAACMATLVLSPEGSPDTSQEDRES